MRVLMLSRDPNIFRVGADAELRHRAYKKLVDRLSVLSFGRWFCKLKDFSWSGYDLVVAQDPFETGFLGLIVSWIFRAHLQVQIHTDFMNPLLKNESLLYKIRTRIARFVLPRVSCVRVVSRRIEEHLVASGVLRSQNISRIPIVSPQPYSRGAAISLLKNRYPHFTHIFFMASRLVREKNISLALHTFSRLLRNYPGAGLVIAGDGPLRASLERECRALGIEKSVVFLGWVDSLHNYFSSADLFIVSSDYEGYCVALVEAAKARCPIVTTDVGLVGDLLGASEAAIVSPRDEGELFHAITDTIENPEIRMARVESAFRRVNELPSWETYLEMYKQSWLTCGMTE